MAILAGGQSLTIEQVERCRGKCRVIAINRAYQLAPWADWVWAADVDRFWRWHPDVIEHQGERITVAREPMPPSRERDFQRLQERGARVVRWRDGQGASSDPSEVRGKNGAHHVLSSIMHTGASTVLLLGVDMHGRHWHEPYPSSPSERGYHAWIDNLGALVEPLALAGVAVLNCSPGSAVPYWPRIDLEAVL